MAAVQAECERRLGAAERKVYALAKERDALRRASDKLSSAHDLLKEKDSIIAQVLHPTLADRTGLFMTCTWQCQDHACGNLLGNLVACIAYDCKAILPGGIAEVCRFEPLQNRVNCISAQSSVAHMAKRCSVRCSKLITDRDGQAGRQRDRQIGRQTDKDRQAVEQSETQTQVVSNVCFVLCR